VVAAFNDLLRQTTPAFGTAASAVSEFEESHPRLVEVVNRMAAMLAGSGI